MEAKFEAVKASSKALFVDPKVSACDTEAKWCDFFSASIAMAIEGQNMVRKEIGWERLDSNAKPWVYEPFKDEVYRAKRQFYGNIDM